MVERPWRVNTGVSRHPYDFDKKFFYSTNFIRFYIQTYELGISWVLGLGLGFEFFGYLGLGFWFGYLVNQLEISKKACFK